MSKNLLVRVQELQDAMTSCQKSTANLIDDYQLSVLQTAAVMANSKINEEKAQIEKKKELVRRQIEKEKESSRVAVDNVYFRAKQSIEALISDKNKELQDAMTRMERQHKEEIARVKTQTHGRKPSRSLLKLEKGKCPKLEGSPPDQGRKVEDEGTKFTCANCGKLSTTMLMCQRM
ncbi:hypothetical protein OS493_037496 [Desmophyllum pertusum]|uniref:Uncharacterized protein n=1 Tax=Desmophyllum pertusum TaxID=174260 RepID=A0A9W9YUC5_9CNID|nr:hypothetical protein OS493_037496 [Desmophyllum pertusum]